MLQNVRDFAANRVIRWVFILFLVVPFGLFGIDAYINRVGSGEAIATVGSARITPNEFDQAVRKQADIYRQQFRGSFDATIMENPQIKRAVLDQLISEKLVGIGSDRAGVRIPDKALAERISAEPFFQDDGKFSKQRYEEIARSQGLTPPGLDERLRQDYRAQQFRGSIADTAFVPKTTLDSFIRLAEQTREVSVVNFEPDAYLAKVKVAPERVKAYYDGHAAEFTTPERVRVEYVELSVDALAAKAVAPAEDVKRIYDEGMVRNQWGKSEERRASHILIPVAADAKDADRKAAQARAQAIADRVRKAPKTFAEVAKKESQDPGSAAKGGDLGFFGHGAMLKSFEEAAFAAKKGEIVGPVTTDFGFHVIQVTDIKPAQVKSLAEATPEIEAGLKKQIAARQFAESAEAFSNNVYEQSTSLKPAADGLKLTVQQSPWLTKGQPSPLPALGNPKLAAEIFSDDAIKAKRNTSAVEVAPNTLVAAHVLEYKPAELRPLDSAKAVIERRLQRADALLLAKADGEAKLKELKAGKVADVKWPAPLAVNRQKPRGVFPQVVDQAFRVDGKKLPAYLGVETPAGYSLVQVSKIVELDKVDDTQRATLGSQLRNAIAAQELESALSSLRDRVGVSVRKGAFDRKEGDVAK
jgi:peptidyl-prolyl cis-trans isomerase D